MSARSEIEQRLTPLLDAQSEYGLMFTDAEGQISAWSKGAESITGYPREEALGQSLELIYTGDAKQNGQFRREIETAAAKGDANDESWHQRRDGTRFYAIGRMVALRKPNGELFGFAKIFRNATLQKTASDTLLSSDALFKSTFGQAPWGMLLMNLEGTIVDVNAALLNLTGFSQPALVGQQITQLTAPEFREDAQSLLQELFSGQRENFVLEKKIQCADGSQIWVQNSAALVRDIEGRPTCAIDMCHEISTLKETEEELTRRVEERTKALTTKTDQLEGFCYTIAHDLRAPLRAIRGYAQVLEEEAGAKLDHESRQQLGRIIYSSDRLDQLVIDLLQHTRIQQLEISHEVVDLQAVVARAIDHVKQESDSSRARFEVTSPLEPVWADFITLEHVFLNLISNAVKFSRRDVWPVIKIYSEVGEQRVRVCVEDNGIGIDPRFRERIFGIFERLGSSAHLPGTGIGLAIVATAMERLHGSCGVEPNSPNGSRFWIELPRSGAAFRQEEMVR